jgi:hypothetical protein
MTYILSNRDANAQQLYGCQSKGTFPVVLEWAGSGAPATQDNRVFYVRTLAKTTSFSRLFDLMTSLQSEFKMLNGCRHACQVRISLGHGGPDLTASLEDVVLGDAMPGLQNLKQAWNHFAKLQRQYQHGTDGTDSAVQARTPVVLALSLYSEAGLALQYIRGGPSTHVEFERMARHLIRTCEGARQSLSVYLALRDARLKSNRVAAKYARASYDVKAYIDCDFDASVASRVVEALEHCRHKDTRALLDVPPMCLNSPWFVQHMCKLLGQEKLRSMSSLGLHVRLSNEFRKARIHYMLGQEMK